MQIPHAHVTTITYTLYMHIKWVATTYVCLYVLKTIQKLSTYKTLFADVVTYTHAMKQ